MLIREKLKKFPHGKRPVATLVPEVFLDFSPLEKRRPRISIAASRLSHLRRRKIKKILWDQGTTLPFNRGREGTNVTQGSAT